MCAGKWGYSCCHSFVRNAYCTGQRGIEAARDAEDLMRHNLEARVNTTQHVTESHGCAYVIPFTDLRSQQLSVCCLSTQLDSLPPLLHM